MKALDTKRTRLVMTGPVDGPDKLWAEYGVVDGDLSDLGKRQDVGLVDQLLDGPTSHIWSGVIDALEVNEDISS